MRFDIGLLLGVALVLLTVHVDLALDGRAYWFGGHIEYVEGKAMTHMTDEQVLQNMNERYDMARSAQKEGKGTPRPHGAAGLIAAEWMRYRNEAKRRGLV